MTTTTNPTPTEIVDRYAAHHTVSPLTDDDRRILRIVENHVPLVAGNRPALDKAIDLGELAVGIAALVESIRDVFARYQQELDDYRALLADVEATRRVLGLSLAQPPAYDDVETGIGGE